MSLFVAATRGAVLLMARRSADAEQEYRRALELDPNFWRALVGLGRCYEARGDYEQATLCFERATSVSDNVPTAIGALGRAYAMAGKRNEARQLLSKLDNISRHRYVSPYGRVLIYLGLKDDAVFDWLERSCNERAGWLMFLATDPRFDPLRGDARFQRLLEKLHLPKIDRRRAFQPSLSADETVLNLRLSSGRADCCGEKMNITAGLNHSRNRRPEKLAIVYGERSWTYAELDELQTTCFQFVDRGCNRGTGSPSHLNGPNSRSVISVV